VFGGTELDVDADHCGEGVGVVRKPWGEVVAAFIVLMASLSLLV
jgi:hypothetical protein